MKSQLSFNLNALTEAAVLEDSPRFPQLSETRSIQF